jgi:hypothetical protein
MLKIGLSIVGTIVLIGALTTFVDSLLGDGVVLAFLKDYIANIGTMLKSGMDVIRQLLSSYSTA